VLARDYGIEPAEADETVDVIGADDALAAHLDVLAGAPVLQVWRVSRTSDGLPFEFARDLFRADRTRMHLHRYGPRWKRARVTPL